MDLLLFLSDNFLSFNFDYGDVNRFNPHKQKLCRALNF